VFREKLKIGEGGETGADTRFLEAIFDRSGAYVLGKRMFEEGDAACDGDVTCAAECEQECPS